MKLPYAIPPRLPDAAGVQSSEHVGFRALLLPASLVATLGWLGIQGEPSFLSPYPLSSTWLLTLVDLWTGGPYRDFLLSLQVGVLQGLLFFVWTWPALRRSPTKIPRAFLAVLGLLTAVNLLWVLSMLAWTMMPFALIPVTLLALGITHRRENEPLLLAWYYASAFAWFAFSAFSWPPSVWI